MVSVTISILINHIRHTLSGNLKLPYRKLLLQWPWRRRNEKIVASILYPGRLKDGKLANAQLMSTARSFVMATEKAPVTNAMDMPVTPHYRPPRAPIVLCHGLYGFDRRGPEALPQLQVHYWGGIEKALASLGAKVIVTRVPRTGSIWERAQVLHSILKMTMHGGEVNFVAHSMGGLDCRYLLSRVSDRPYRVRSLTTISTPHRGSPVMDWFRDNVGVGAPDLNDTARESAFKRLIQFFDAPAYANLTTDYCQGYFNPNTPDDPTVAYYSYGAAAEIPVWSILGLPWQMVMEKEGPNDTIVSVKSATWGKYIKTLPADHWELSGQRHRWRAFVMPSRYDAPTSLPLSSSSLSSELETASKFDTMDFYIEMATLLHHEGH